MHTTNKIYVNQHTHARTHTKQIKQKNADDHTTAAVFVSYSVAFMILTVNGSLASFPPTTCRPWSQTEAHDIIHIEYTGAQ